MIRVMNVMKEMIMTKMSTLDCSILFRFQVEPPCKKAGSMMKVMIKMKMLKIDSSKLLQFQVEPTCKEEGSMVGGGWSLYTKRSCQGGGEVKQRVVYMFLFLYFYVDIS